MRQAPSPSRCGTTPYSGINIIMLWQAAMACRYSAPIWMTYRQASELGALVRKGENGELVVYANTITRTETGDDGQDAERVIPFLKGYTVFNVEQIDGLHGHYYQLAEPKRNPVQRIEHAETLFAALGAETRHGGDMAYYAVGSDHADAALRNLLRCRELLRGIGS